MANVNYFIKTARDQGYTDDEINSILVQKGQKPISNLRKFVESSWIPVLGGGAGLLGGAAFAAPTLGASLPAGGLIGASTGTALQKSLEDLLGYQTQKGTDQVGEAVNNGFLGATAGEGLNLARFFASPMASLGRTRSALIGDKTVPTQEFQQKSLQNLNENPYYKLAPTDTKQIANDQFMKFHANQVPAENSSINDIYSSLKPFEAQGKAYGGNTPTAQGTNLASRAIRSYLSQNIPWPARKVNDLYGLLSKAKPAIPWLSGAGAGGFGLFEILKLLKSAATQ